MTASRTLAFCLAFVSVASGWTQQTGKLTYQNPDAPVDSRVRDLLSRMTLEEKVAQLESFTNKPVLPGTHLETAIEGDHLNEVVLRKIFANGLGTYAFMDEFAGLSGDANSGAEHRNLLQQWVLKNTRLVYQSSFTERHCTAPW
jgi:beta-glucosidase